MKQNLELPLAYCEIKKLCEVTQTISHCYAGFLGDIKCKMKSLFKGISTEVEEALVKMKGK